MVYNRLSLVVCQNMLAEAVTARGDAALDVRN